jgi:Cof subfamily protein (haloacid dehalogenase superfamily)
LVLYTRKVQTPTRLYDALLLDVDGTLLDVNEQPHPATRAALTRARAAGVVVMLATGRSSGGVRGIARELTPGMPAIVFNGAALYEPGDDRLIEMTALSATTAEQVLAHARQHGMLPVVATREGQYSRPAITAAEGHVLAAFRQLHISSDALPLGDVIRITLLSPHHANSLALYAEIQAVIDGPAYLTHFALSSLPHFVGSPFQIVDVQPDCGGKAAALRVLAERYGIAAERVVAVGDADNDLPMLRHAGLGVAMGNATPAAKDAADRVIGDHNGDALGLLIDELFLTGSETP